MKKFGNVKSLFSADFVWQIYRCPLDGRPPTLFAQSKYVVSSDDWVGVTSADVYKFASAWFRRNTGMSICQANKLNSFYHFVVVVAGFERWDAMRADAGARFISSAPAPALAALV